MDKLDKIFNDWDEEEFECFPFEKDNFEKLGGGTVTVRKLATYDIVADPGFLEAGLVYAPYVSVEKTPTTIEEDNMLEYFHKKLIYASKIPMERFETITIKK